MVALFSSREGEAWLPILDDKVLLLFYPAYNRCRKILKDAVFLIILEATTRLVFIEITTPLFREESVALRDIAVVVAGVSPASPNHFRMRRPPGHPGSEPE
jgi:hypothetical protein